MPSKSASAKKANVPSNLFATQGSRPRFTGKRIVTMNQEAKPSSIHKLSKNASLKVASINDFSSDIAQYREAFARPWPLLLLRG